MTSIASILKFGTRKWNPLWFVGIGIAFLAAMPQALAQNYFFIPPAGAAGDYDDSGQVAQGDLDLVLLNWGQDASQTGVPEGWINEQPTGLIGQGTLDGVLLNWGLSSAPIGDWEDPNFWFRDGNIVGLPDSTHGAIIHRNRTANLSSDVGFIPEMRIGDTCLAADPNCPSGDSVPGGTLNINPGGKVQVLGQVLLGASNPGTFKEGELNLNGGTLVTFGAMHVAFESGSTHTVNIAPGSLLDVNSDLFGRFGTATINQTGGTVDVQNNVIWGEGGDDDGLDPLFITRSEYNLSAGELIVGNTLAIGGSIGIPRPTSDGRMNVTGGMVTSGDLVFDTFPGEEAILNIEGSGVVRIDQANYSEADANSDISGGYIIGPNLSVSTVVDGTTFTQIVSLPPLGGVSAIPEPTTACLTLICVSWGVFLRQRRAGCERLSF